jgi:site-specific DNA recombinase
MIAAMAQWEREEIASRVAASVPIRAQMGKQIGGKPSFGYKWVNKELVIDEQFAPVRKLVYELFLKHKRKKTVARILNEAGYRTRSNTKFSDASVTHMLRDPMAKGVRRVNYTRKSPTKNKTELKPVSDWVMHPCPALVSAEVWDECNRLLDESLIKNKRPGPRPKHLMAGYVYCADCDKRMYVYHRTNTENYRCNNCSNHIMAADLEAIYHGELKEFLLTGVSVSEYMEKIDIELQEKEKLLAIILGERDSLSKKADTFIEMRMNNELSKDAFAERYKPMEERLAQLNNQLPELQAEIDRLRVQHYSSDTVLKDATDLYKLWDSMPYDEKRTVIEAITDKISVGKQDIHIKLSYLPTQLPPAADPARRNPSIQNPVKRQSNV